MKISWINFPAFVEASLDATDLKIKESIRAQIEFHKKQKDLIRVKQASWEEFCRQVASLQIRMSNISADGSTGDGLQVFSVMKQTDTTLHSYSAGLDISHFPRDGVSAGTSPCRHLGGGLSAQPAQHWRQDAEG